MSNPKLPTSRRWLTAAALGLLLVGGAAIGPALLTPCHAASQSAQSYTSVTVDTSPLGASLYKPTGERLRAMIEDEVKRRFSVTGDSSKPRIVVRVTDLVVPSGNGHAHPNGPENAPPKDRMDGETLIIAPDGKVLGRYPVTVSAPAAMPGVSAGGLTSPNDSDVESDFRRLGELVKSYASWSARYAQII